MRTASQYKFNKKMNKPMIGNLSTKVDSKSKMFRLHLFISVYKFISNKFYGEQNKRPKKAKSAKRVINCKNYTNVYENFEKAHHKCIKMIGLYSYIRMVLKHH